MKIKKDRYAWENILDIALNDTERAVYRWATDKYDNRPLAVIVKEQGLTRSLAYSSLKALVGTGVVESDEIATKPRIHIDKYKKASPSLEGRLHKAWKEYHNYTTRRR